MTTASMKLNVLIVEDEVIDADIIARNLRNAGYDLEWTRVETELEYREALAARPDIVLSDYSLPQFNGLRALAVLLESHADIPFILISGGVSEEQAVEIMRLGAADFLFKDRLGRLPSAVAAVLEKQRLHEQTRQVEQRFGAFLENTPSITFTKDMAGRYLHVNRQFLLAFNKHADAVLGKTTEEVFPDAEATQFRENDRKVLESGVAMIFEEQAEYADGPHTALVTRFPLRDTNHGVYAIGGVITDITERKIAEERFRATFEQATVGIAHTSLDNRYLMVNHKLCEMLGYNREEMLKLHTDNIVSTDDRASQQERRQQLLDNKIASYSGEIRYRRKDGSLFWVNRTVSVARAENGTPLYLIRVVEDITERKQAEHRVLRLNRLYSTLSATSIAIVRAHDRETLFHAVCRIAVEEGGFSAAWVRTLESETQRLEMVACAGVNEDFFFGMNTAVNPAMPEGRGPAGLAIRENRIVICNDMLNDPICAPWWETARRHGFRALATLPLTCDGQTIGILALKATETNFFDDELVKLLHDMIGDISLALTGFNLQAQHQRIVQALQETDEQFRQLAMHVPQVFWITDAKQQTTIYASPAYEAVTGRPLQDLMQDPRAWLQAVHEEDRRRVQYARKKLAPQGTYDIEYRLQHTDGTVRWMHDRAFPVKNAQGEIYRITGIAEDVTERKQAREHLDHLAHYDSVTGLPNRVLFHDRLQQSLAQARRNNWMVGVLFMDLDRFKLVNDTLGHAAGDVLLQQVAARLTQCLRPSDTVGRLSGDEFAMILSSLSDPQNAGHVAQKIIDALTAPFNLDGDEVCVTASIGITLYPDDSDSMETLIRDADAAMYSAKAAGRNNFQYYTAEMNQRTTEKLRLEVKLRRALERGEYILHYQPKVDITSGEIAGFEALLRWQSPDGVLVAPDQFIPLLEETGLIVQVGDWVTRAACAQIHAWREAGITPVPVAINLSARQLRHAGFSTTLSRALSEFKVPANLIEIEVTESSLMENPEQAIIVLTELNTLGIRLSADDFGTGYSSLSYLKRLPLNTLKIDRSFVRDITIDPDDAAIARTVIMLAHSLGLKVVAEGVETEEQLAFLGDNHCDEAQGYLFSRPLPADACIKLLADGHLLHRARLPEGTTDIPALLVVDDDRDHLALTSHLLRRDGHQVLGAATTREAFDLLATHRVGMVVSDQNMPDMDGVEFLRRVKLMYPDAVRVMLSGVGDFDTATAAINEGEVHKFFVKGRDEDLLRSEIRKTYWRERVSPLELLATHGMPEPRPTS